MFDACVRPYDLMWWLWFFFYSQIFLVSFYISHSSFTIGFLFMNFVRRFFIVAVYVLVLCTHDFCWMNEIRFFIFVTALNARLVFIFADSIILENQINEWIEWEIWNSDWISFCLSIWAWMTFPLTFMESSKVWAHF